MFVFLMLFKIKDEDNIGVFSIGFSRDFLRSNLKFFLYFLDYGLFFFFIIDRNFE